MSQLTAATWRTEEGTTRSVQFFVRLFCLFFGVDEVKPEENDGESEKTKPDLFSILTSLILIFFIMLFLLQHHRVWSEDCSTTQPVIGECFINLAL